MVRQAVVMIHGMGEQRPLDTLNGFISIGLPPNASGRRLFYSRPERVTNSFEARRYLAPRQPVRGEPEIHAQTDFYEYHWAHLMQGNRLSDIWPAFRRLLIRWPWSVPSGLRGLWVLVWAALFAIVWLFWFGPLSALDLGSIPNVPPEAVRTVVGGGLVALVIVSVLTKIVPRWITSSFVDVVRYLDTSPRSYAVRRDVRAGIVALLRGLEETGRYQRVIIVAHSLGTYIAYDAITYLWGQLNPLRPASEEARGEEPTVPDGLRDLEFAASNLDGTDAARERFRLAQRELWRGIRRDETPWLVTDFISFGSPMYFADQLYTRDEAQFRDRVAKRELPTCPPEPEPAAGNNIFGFRRWYSWNNRGKRVLYHAAPFAVIRWTNLYFPARFGFFGDWFGGPLKPLFGDGIKDVALTRGRWWRLFPGWAHSKYLSFPDDDAPGTATRELRDAMDLAASSWLSEFRREEDQGTAAAGPD